MLTDMKTKILIPIFALLMQVTVTAQSKESETESKISAVTVFFSGAQINRKILFRSSDQQKGYSQSSAGYKYYPIQPIVVLYRPQQHSGRRKQ